MHLRHAFERTAEAFPGTTAIVDGASRLTYEEWHAHIRRAAAGVARHVPRGERLLVAAPSGLRHATLFWAAQFAGAVSVHVDPRVKPEEAVRYVEDAAPRLVVGAADFPSRGVPALRIDDDGEWERFCQGEPPAPDYDEQALSHMVYTSGTTGVPKGVPLTHGGACVRALSVAVHSGLASFDRVLGVMPFFHQMGLVGNFAVSAFVGATYVAAPRFEPAAALDLLERERITMLFASPTHFALMAADASIERRDLSSLMKAVYGGAPMSAAQLEFWSARLGHDLVHLYGTTETMCTLVNRQAARKPLSAGRPGLHHRVRLVRLGSRNPDDVVTEGEGELVVQIEGSAECFDQYWRKPESFRDAVVRGWYFTGDTARRDADGDYEITGRIKNLIRSGAESIHPEEVERVLSAHPGVRDAAVFGLPDPVWGEVVAALVVAARPLAAAEIDAWFRAQADVADHKRPRQIAFVDAIPRNVSGKLVRAEAVALMERERTRAV
jgi:2-furoate---CoA ligase